MKPDKLTILELFQRERRYVVPLYQRADVWEQQGQWAPLWEDIERQAEACLDPETAKPETISFPWRDRAEWKFTDPVLREAKRNEIVAALEARENVTLLADTVSKRRTSDDAVRAVVAISKHYTDR